MHAILLSATIANANVDTAALPPESGSDTFNVQVLLYKREFITTASPWHKEALIARRYFSHQGPVWNYGLMTDF
jgi:hypothetical protein